MRDYLHCVLQNLCVVDPEGLFSPNSPKRLFVRLLSCDTITQAKEKILDAIYRTTPYSVQLRPTDVVLGEFHVYV